MQINEGITQRGPYQELQQGQQQQNENANEECSFKRQRTIGKFSQAEEKRLSARKRKNVKGHTFLEPRWDNSFTLESPLAAILALIAIGIYLYCLFFTQLMETDKQRLGWGIFVILLYIIECCCNGVIGYLRNKMSLSDLQAYLEEIKQLKFELKYDVSAYHYETRRYYSSKGKSKTSTETVTTYNESFIYPLSQCIDQTEDSTIYFEKAKYFRIHNFVSFSFGNEQSSKYYDDMIKFAQTKAKSRDSHTTQKETWNCSGLKTNILACQDGVKADPMLSIPVYFIYCLLGLSLLYRILLNKRVCFLEHCVHKELYLDVNNLNVEIQAAEMMRLNVSNQYKILQNQEVIIQQQQQLLQNLPIQNGLPINNNLNLGQQQPNYNYPLEPQQVPNPMS